MTQYFFLEISENKNTAWNLLYKQWLCKCYKVYEDYVEFDTNAKYAQEDKKTSLQEESLENPVLNKIMTTYE